MRRNTMYGEGNGFGKGSIIIPAAGVAALPATNGNEFGLILAYAAIAIGVSALIGQVVVRIVRRHYQLRMK